jgi:hypothetical protein
MVRPVEYTPYVKLGDVARETLSLLFEVVAETDYHFSQKLVLCATVALFFYFFSPGTQQRSCPQSVAALGERISPSLFDDGQLRPSSVLVPTGEAGLLAEVLCALPARSAAPADVAEPRDADPVTHGEPLDTRPEGNDAADDLVAEHDRRAPQRELAGSEMEVRAAHPARLHLDQHLARSWLGLGSLDEVEPRAR